MIKKFIAAAVLALVFLFMPSTEAADTYMLSTYRNAIQYDYYVDKDHIRVGKDNVAVIVKEVKHSGGSLVAEYSLLYKTDGHGHGILVRKTSASSHGTFVYLQNSEQIMTDIFHWLKERGYCWYK